MSIFWHVSEGGSILLVLDASVNVEEIQDTYKNLKDEDVVALINSGDEEAVDCIFKRYRKYIKSKARVYFLTGGGREDIEQEAMMGLYAAIKGYKAEKKYSFRAFAEVCITRHILTAIKTATRQKHIPLNSYVSLNKLVYAEDNDKTRLIDEIKENRINDPEDILVCKESYKLLEDFITSKLSCLEIKILKAYLKGKSYEEIGKEINKDKKSVDNALQRIKKKILVLENISIENYNNML